MLIKCPECELQVSDKAQSCPHCGYPMKQDTKQRKPRNPNHKRRRLPNGFGQISEIRNRNLRKLFRAMVTVGKDTDGKPICKMLKPDAYFATYNDAYAALVEYNRNPYDLQEGITVKELYERWFEEYSKSVNNETSLTITKIAWRYCTAVYDMRVIDLRNRHIKGCIENGVAVIDGKEQKPKPTTQARIKTMFNLMLDYAVEYEIVDRNCARSFGLSKDVRKNDGDRKSHITFTDEEMDLMWKALGNLPYVDVLLIQCYSGWRPKELCLLEVENVDIENWMFTGGMKTDAGTNRPVPIHSRIQPLVMKRYEEAKALGSKYLFNYSDTKSRSKDTMLTYQRYKKKFDSICEELDLDSEHRPHDGRVRFITAAKQASVDEYAIKYMVGHAISDITEKIYTKRDIQWLKDEIEKIK